LEILLSKELFGQSFGLMMNFMKLAAESPLKEAIPTKGR